MACGSVGLPHERVGQIDRVAAVFDRALKSPGPRMIEIDVAAIGPFSHAFAGPPAGATGKAS
jgi:acetolactate synthase-1/2/3 large subunit